MRLHRLSLGAVGPFVAAYDLDLDAVAVDGLFLLEGPTGAGKSTVLDAVTFAFYGAVAGRGASKDRLHTDFETTLEPFVELEFSVGGVRHRIRRTPAHSRAKRHGTGTTPVQSTVRLWRIEAQADVVLSVRVREVDDEIRRLLGGLSCEQFRQVVVLPQGEFATFLRADADERRDVLQRLFRTEHYQAVEQALVEMRKDANARVGRADALVRDALVALRQAGGDDAVDLESLLDASDDARRVRLDLLEDVLREAADRAGESERAAQVRRDAAAAEHAAVLERRRRSEHRRDAEAHRTRLAAEASVIEDLVLLRDSALRAQAIAPVLREVAVAGEAVDRADQQFALRDAREPEDRSADPDPRDLRSVAGALRAEAAGLEPALSAEASLPEQTAALGEAQVRLAALAAERSDVIDRVDRAPEALAVLRGELESTRVLAVGLGAATERLESAHGRARAWLRLPQVTAELVAAQDALRRAVDHAQDARELYLSSVQERLRGMAAELAVELEDGLPCVVCGSVEHPHPAVPVSGAIDAARLAELELAASSAADSRLAASARAAEAQAALDATRLDSGPIDPSAELAALAEGVAEARVATGRVAELEEAVVRAEDAIGSDRLRLSSLETEIATVAERTRSLELAVARDTRTVELAQEGCASVSQRALELLARAQALEATAEAATDRRRAGERHARALVLAREAALEAGFADIDAARSALTDDETLDQMAARIASHQGGWAVVSAALADPEIAGADPEPADPVPSSDLLDVADAARDKARAEADAARARMRDVHACRAHLVEVESGTVEVRAETRPVVRVADAVTGQGTVNPRRITLSTYVLRERFDSVVVAASRRLERMSSGRFVLERDELSSGTKKAGLGLAVLDQWTGTRRDTRTLSGGESFYASLALALGLADVVRDEAGGVELETLFIDEGFATLDADTLESVLDVIDALRDGGRVVGIVSHVAELKERIPDRIEVRRLADGSSSVAVRA